MSWADWVPAITSSTVLGALGFLIGTAYKANVERSIQHSFDRKLEELRATIRKSDEQISALRSGALSALATRQANVDKRRLAAVERLWAETVHFNKYRYMTMLAGAMDIILRNASGRGRDATKTREFAASILQAAGLDEPKPMSNLADNERPFLDPVCWALFSAYRQANMYAVMLMQFAKLGMGAEILESGTPAVLGALKAALPEQAVYMDQTGLGSLFHVLQPLEDKLLAALIESLNGREASDAAIRHSAEIIQKVNEAETAMKPRPPIPL